MSQAHSSVLELCLVALTLLAFLRCPLLLIQKTEPLSSCVFVSLLGQLRPGTVVLFLGQSRVFQSRDGSFHNAVLLPLPWGFA